MGRSAVREFVVALAIAVTIGVACVGAAVFAAGFISH